VLIPIKWNHLSEDAAQNQRGGAGRNRKSLSTLSGPALTLGTCSNAKLASAPPWPPFAAASAAPNFAISRHDPDGGDLPAQAMTHASALLRNIKSPKSRSVERFEIRARVTLAHPQVWSAEGTRNSPGIDRSWTGKNVGLPIKRALKPVHDVTDGSDRDSGLAKSPSIDSRSRLPRKSQHVHPRAPKEKVPDRRCSNPQN
jgi:hypothetical protein